MLASWPRLSILMTSGGCELGVLGVQLCMKLQLRLSRPLSMFAFAISNRLSAFVLVGHSRTMCSFTVWMCSCVSVYATKSCHLPDSMAVVTLVSQGSPALCHSAVPVWCGVAQWSAHADSARCTVMFLVSFLPVSAGALHSQGRVQCLYVCRVHTVWTELWQLCVSADKGSLRLDHTTLGLVSVQLSAGP